MILNKQSNLSEILVATALHIARIKNTPNRSNQYFLKQLSMTLGYNKYWKVKA
jgi:hypothetical protein